MKRLVSITIMSLFVLASCSKTDKPIVESNATTQSDLETCDFGLRNFNLTKRAPGSEDNGVRARGNTVTTTAVSSTTGVILVDFDGQTVSGTNWNLGQTFVCAPANLSSAAVESILQRMSNDYAPFNVIVTTDESLYNSALANKRMRVIVTETWEWFGQAGGTSFVGSFTWGDNTPCFVFSSLLNYNTKNVAEAASHEVGHTLGLYHQSLYDANCNKISEYNSGVGTGEIAWAPIMGVGYYRNLSIWHKGSNAYGCSNIQDDIAVIAAITGLKSDDFPNTTQQAPTITNAVAGMINSNSDVDVFKVTISATRTFILAPVNTGSNNESGDLDLQMKIYNSQGNLITIIDNTEGLSATTVLPAGTYYVSAGTVSNVNISNYSMVGNYTLSIY